MHLASPKKPQLLLHSVIQLTQRTMEEYVLLTDLNEICPSCKVGYDAIQYIFKSFVLISPIAPLLFNSCGTVTECRKSNFQSKGYQD